MNEQEPGALKGQQGVSEGREDFNRSTEVRISNLNKEIRTCCFSLYPTRAPYWKGKVRLTAYGPSWLTEPWKRL